MTATGPRRSFAAAIAVMAGLAVALSGCLSDPPTSTPSPSPTLEPEPTPVVTRYELGTTAWYAGIVLTIHDATATLDAKGGPIVVELTLQNPTESPATLGGPIVLADPSRELAPTRESQIPAVEPGATVATTVTFEVDELFVVPAASIVVGRATEHRVIVPLVAGAVAPVTLEPVATEVDGRQRVGDLDVSLDRVELRADLPDWNLELPREAMALTVHYEATFRSDFPGGAAFTAANVSLLAPDGQTIGPRRDGHSQVNALLRPFRRNLLSTRFEVPAPGPGTYALVVRDEAGATASLPFTIPAP